MHDVSDRIRSVTEALYQELIDAEATALIGAGKYERTDDRTTQRNGTRAWSTRPCSYQGLLQQPYGHRCNLRRRLVTYR